MTTGARRAFRPLGAVENPIRGVTPPPRLSVIFAIAAVAMQLTISANLLFLMGIHYDIPGGNPLFKINPATDVAILALLIRLFETGDPAGTLLRLFAVHRLLGAFMVLMLACIAYALASVGVTGLAAYMDSYLSAGILLLVLYDASAAEKRALGTIILTLMLTNATIAVAETVTQHHLMPFYLGATRLETTAHGFRGVALYDHPLTGAMMTSMGVFLLLQMRLRLIVTAALAGWLVVGLFAFGGRASLVTTLSALAALGAWSLIDDLLRRRLTVQKLLGIIAALVFGLLIAWLVINETSIADRIVHQDYVDASAKAREVEWLVPGLMNAREILFGVEVNRLPELMYQVGLDSVYGDIENFWLLAFINLGLIGFLVYLGGFLALLADLWRRAPLFGRTMLLVVIAVASTSDSLGRKSNILFVLAATIVAISAYAERTPSLATLSLRSPPIIPRRVSTTAPARALMPLTPLSRKK